METSEQRKCSRCTLHWPKDNFANNGYCKPCNREYGQENYQKNKARYKATARARDLAQKTLIDALKDKPCADCGKRYPPYVMDFDHRPGEGKLTNIAAMKRRRFSLEAILAEIAKCDVVCSNCHRERTHKRSF